MSTYFHDYTCNGSVDHYRYNISFKPLTQSSTYHTLQHYIVMVILFMQDFFITNFILFFHFSINIHNLYFYAEYKK